MATFVPAADIVQVVTQAATSGLEDVGQDIADDANDNTTLHILRTERWGYRPTVDSEGVHVGSPHGLAAMDEFGTGRGGLSHPSGALRSAAAKQGRFEPEAKP